MSRKRSPDLTGRRFGLLTVDSQAVLEFGGKRQSVCTCVCDCGNRISVPASKLIRCDGSLVPHSFRSCGCQRKHEDLTGQRIGRLTVGRKIGSTQKRGVMYECKCDCGTIKIIPAYQLASASVKSCGCLLREHQQKIGAISAEAGVASHTPDVEAARYRTTHSDGGKYAARVAATLEKALAESFVLAGGTNVPALTNAHPQGKNPYRGVCWNKRKNCWMAYCCVGGMRWQKNGFRSAEDAKEARDKMHEKLIEATGLQDAIEARAEYKAQKNHEKK